MDEQPSVFSKDTLIPISVLFIAGASIVGSVMWLANISSSVVFLREGLNQTSAKCDAIQRDVQEQKNKQTAVDAKMDYIVSSLDDIKKKLNIIK